MTTKKTGDAAEVLACRFLLDKGLQLLQRNYRCKRGEIDLIMKDCQDILVFVEVRYRRRTHFGRAFETVDRNKRKRIAYCALCYLSRQRALNQNARFDVVAIEGDAGHERITWLRNAFEVEV